VKMMRTRFALLSSLVLTCIVYAHPSKVEVIRGQVVANTGLLSCLNGYEYESVVVRIESPVKNSKFIFVRLSFPCGTNVKWVADAPIDHQFRLQRNLECDAVLEGTLDPAGLDGKEPLWVSAKGIDTTELPFGKMLPCYDSAEFPVSPVV